MATDKERIEALERQVTKLTHALCNHAAKLEHLRKNVETSVPEFDLPSFPDWPPSAR